MYNFKVDEINLTLGEDPEIKGHLVTKFDPNKTNTFTSENAYLNPTATWTINTTQGDGFLDISKISSEKSNIYVDTGRGDWTSITTSKPPEVETIIIDENDIIVITVDFNEYGLDEAEKIIRMWQMNFPNHKVIMKPKGMDIMLIKDNGAKENEVEW